MLAITCVAYFTFLVHSELEVGQNLVVAQSDQQLEHTC